MDFYWKSQFEIDPDALRVLQEVRDSNPHFVAIENDIIGSLSGPDGLVADLIKEEQEAGTNTEKYNYSIDGSTIISVRVDDETELGMCILPVIYKKVDDYRQAQTFGDPDANMMLCGEVYDDELFISFEDDILGSLSGSDGLVADSIKRLGADPNKYFYSDDGSSILSFKIDAETELSLCLSPVIYKKTAANEAQE